MFSDQRRVGKKRESKEEADREIDELRGEVNEILKKAKDKNYITILTKKEMSGKKKAMKTKMCSYLQIKDE